MFTRPATVMARLGCLLALTSLLSACAPARFAAPAPSAELTPTGKMRAVINLSNPILASKDSAGQPRGVSVNLAHEPGKRLGVPVKPTVVDAAGKAVEATKTSQADIAFVAIDPVRGADMLQTPAYIFIEEA